jgi:hypothetical protein
MAKCWIIDKFFQEDSDPEALHGTPLMCIDSTNETSIF